MNETLVTNEGSLMGVNTKILFLNPPYFTKKGHVVYKEQGGGIGFTKLGNIREAKKRPILDMLHSVQICEDEGFTSDVFDDQYSPSDDFEEFIDQIEDLNQYDYVFIRTALPTIHNDLLIAKKLKPLMARQGKICIFGPAVLKNIHWYKKFTESFDVLVSSEITAVVKDIASGIKPSTIQGCYESIKGELVCDDPTDAKADLESLPYLPYHRPMFKGYEKYIISSQGCPIGCNYCPYILSQGTKFRARTPKQVVDELEYYERELGITQIMFRDPNFGFNNTRAMEICQEIIDRKLTIKWDCETVLVTLKNELIELMGKANLARIQFGIESLLEEVLKNSNRPVKLAEHQKVVEKINKCHSAGITTYGFFVIGLEGDTIKNILETPEYAISLNLNRAQFMTPNLYPGTKLHEDGLEQGLISQDMLSDAEKYFDKIGSHGKVQFNLSQHLNLIQLRIAKSYCDHLWANHKKRNNSIKRKMVGIYLKMLKRLLLASDNTLILSPVYSVYKLLHHVRSTFKHV